MSNFARKGFYTFNLDIYLDLNHIKASGNTFTLPGRHVTIADEAAWEQAIILTPRPDQMRAQLIETLQEQFTALPAETIQNTVNKLIFFPDRIQVLNKSVSFFVPADFIGTNTPDTWSVTAFVTGANTLFDSTWSITDKTIDVYSLDLGVMQREKGFPKNSIGYDGKVVPSPIVDLLADTLDTQKRQLSASPVTLTATGKLPTQIVQDARAITTWQEALGVSAADTNNKIETGAKIKTETTPAAAERLGGRSQTQHGAWSQSRILSFIAPLIALAWIVGRSGTYTSGSDAGYLLGLSGGVMMLLLFLYPLRKHVKLMHRWGATKHWYALHMLFGIVGPLFVLMHSTFRVGSLNAGVALASMLLVAGSGVAGRFIYMRIHHGLYGERARLRDLQGRLASQLKDVQAMLTNAPAVDPNARAVMMGSPASSTRRSTNSAPAPLAQ